MFLTIYIFFLVDWLFDKTVKKLVVVILNIDSHEPLERWQFDVECDKEMTEKRLLYPPCKSLLLSFIASFHS